MKQQKFRMMTLAAIIPSLVSRDWFMTLDLQDVYFHVTIHTSHKRHLHFTVNHDHFKCRMLCFGLCSAPKVLSKIMVVVAAYLRQLMIVFLYLYDWFLRDQSYQEVLLAVQMTWSLFHSLGLQLNVKKLSLTAV